MKIDLQTILSGSDSRETKLAHVAGQIRAARGYSWVGIYDVGDKDIRILAHAGRSEPAFSTFPNDKGLNGRAAQQRKPVIVNDIDADEDYLLTFTNTKSEVVVPVPGADQKIVGTIDVASEEKNAFDPSDVEFLEDCARQISTLWNIQHSKQAQSTNK